MSRTEVKVEPSRNPIRHYLSYASYSGMVPPPCCFRPSGISAITMARNEEDWVEASVRSILDFVDELVIADNGSEDATPKTIETLAQTYPEKIRRTSLPSEDFVSGTNFLISQTRFRWILRWHADFVARTSGSSSLRTLVDRTRTLDPRKHFSVALSGIALDGDLEHQFEDRRDIPEPFLYTYSPWLKYYVRAHWEALHVPWFYEKLTWPEVFYFHLRRVKSSMRLLQTVYWSRWFDARNEGRAVSLQDFIRLHATADYDVADVHEAATLCALEWFAGCVPVQPEVRADYPEILRSALNEPAYRLIYANGKLTGRAEGAKSHRLKGGNG